MILCFSSYFKGNRFLQRCKREGCRVLLVTVESRLGEPWARDHLDEVFALPNFDDLRGVINAIAYLMRNRPIDRLVALDDFDVEMVAALREHFRLPGMNASTARLFRDKLAMRCRARDCGIPIPEFTALHNHDAVRHFLATVPGPWLMKPRSQASAMGIFRAQHPDEVWRRLDDLKDEQSFHLLERMIPGDVYHVDALVAARRLLFAEVNKYHRPLLEVYQGGGIFASRTACRYAPEVPTLRHWTGRVLLDFGMEQGASHTEFIRGQDGTFYFLETSARVGGAGVTDMVEAATGINLWEEWARVEIDPGSYSLPITREEYAGVVVSLARQERPDTSGFNDAEVFHRLDIKHHIGLVLRSANSDRIDALLGDYMQRIQRDHHTVLPPSDRATV
jgi:hypothetical protein